MALIVPILPLVGREPLVQGIRNGVVPPAIAMRRLADLANGITGKRKKVVFWKWINQADAYNTTTSADTWRFRFHTSPNTTQVRVRMILAPVDDTEANAPDPRVYWTTTVEGGASTAQATIRHTARVAGGYTVLPNDWRQVTQTWSLTANTTYQATLTQIDKLRVLACTAWEVPNLTLDSATDTVLNGLAIMPNDAIHDADVATIWSNVLTIWQRQRSHLFSWTRPSNSAITTASTSYVNVLDTGTSAWAAASEGFYTYPQVHASHDGYNSGTSRETVAISFGAYISVTGGATVTAALIDQNNTTAAPIATVTSTSATAAWQTTTASWSAPSNAAMKLDVVFKCSSGLQTASCFAAGAFVYTA